MMDSNFQIRDLEESDYDRGYIQLLSNLTETGNISKNAFLDRYKMLKNNGNYVIRVIVDKENDKIIASGTLLIEHKFIHECADKGHIEDIVVDSGYRNQSLGKKMISDLTEIGEKKGLYKISLVCRDEVTGFYEKCGFELKEKEMVKYYK